MVGIITDIGICRCHIRFDSRRATDCERSKSQSAAATDFAINVGVAHNIQTFRAVSATVDRVSVLDRAARQGGVCTQSDVVAVCLVAARCNGTTIDDRAAGCVGHDTIKIVAIATDFPRERRCSTAVDDQAGIAIQGVVFYCSVEVDVSTHDHDRVCRSDSVGNDNVIIEVDIVGTGDVVAQQNVSVGINARGQRTSAVNDTVNDDVGSGR